MAILTLPAFRWFQTNNTGLPPRVRHQCLPTGTNQMISIGGEDPAQDRNTDTNNVTADPWAQGIGVYDMTSLEWKDSYQSKADMYRPPDVIENYYGQKYGSLFVVQAFLLPCSTLTPFQCVSLSLLVGIARSSKTL